MLLDVKNLDISYGSKLTVSGVNIQLDKGEILSIVGESGSGKTTVIRAVMGCLPGRGHVSGGSITFDGRDMLKNTREDWRKISGREMSMIFQDSGNMINPIRRIGEQFTDYILAHAPQKSKAEAAEMAKDMLNKVRLPNPQNIMNSYPFELSGGMRQRVMIAMALACKPKLLIADEPTTALDVTIQAQILNLMNELKREQGTSILFVTHDLGVINQMADDVAVMYCGQVVEMAPAKTLFTDCEFSHPYTEGLMLSIPRLDTPAGVRLESIPGSVPHPLNLPKGCKFAPRCKYCQQRCLEEEPELVNVTEEQQVRCFYPRKEERRANLK